MIKFQHTNINDCWIDMHRECIENDYCFEYKELLNKYDKLLSLHPKTEQKTFYIIKSN